MYINIHIYIIYINLLELYRYVSAKNPKVILRVNLKSNISGYARLSFHFWLSYKVFNFLFY